MEDMWRIYLHQRQLLPILLEKVAQAPWVFWLFSSAPPMPPSPAFEASLWQSSEGLMSSSICSNPLVNYLDVRTKEMAKVTDWVSRGGTA